MMKKIFLISLISILFLCVVIKGEEYINPFIPLLPSEEVIQPSSYSSRETSLNIVVEGIVWSEDMPQVIIEGNIYKEGDEIKGYGAKIIRIEKRKIYILYNGQVKVFTTKSD